VRKAEKLGLEIRPETAADFLEDYWAMSLQTFSKANIEPTHSQQFVVELWRRLNPLNQVLALSAFHGDRRIATLVLPHDDRTMFYWGGASYTEFREVPSHNLLHWRAVTQARSMGLAEYDFISTKGGPGRFKSTFGPRAIDVATHWERSSSKFMASLKQKYERFLRKRRQIAR
jgi:lipid II:glycine glycyltransferase (peptidoglycan interpeptide bridge formation enzyme)